MIRFPYRVHEQHKAALRCCPVLLPASVGTCWLQAADGTEFSPCHEPSGPARSCLTAWIAGAACVQHRACRRLVVGVQITLVHTIAAALSCAMGVTSETVLLSAHILSEGYSVAWRSVFRSASCVGDASLDQSIGVCLTYTPIIMRTW